MTRDLRDLAIETLQTIDERGIEYCVLRNFGFLDGEKIDGDVDVLVPKEERGALEEVFSERGFRRGMGDTSGQTTYLHFHIPSRRLLVFDIYWDTPTYNGLPLLQGDAVFDRSYRHQGIKITHEDDLFVELLFHGALNKGGYRREYRERLHELRARVDRRRVLDHAQAVFGRLGKYAAERALDGNLTTAVSLKWALVATSVARRPTIGPRLVWDLLIRREVVRPLKHVVAKYDPREPKAVIALLGPDGAGKTTVAKEIEEILEESGFEVTVAQLGTYNDRSLVFDVATRIANAFAEGIDWLERTDDEPRKTRTARGERAPTRSLPEKKPKWKSLLHVADISVRYLRARIGTSGVLVADRFVHDVVAYDDVEGSELPFAWFEPDDFVGIVLVGDAETLGARSEYDIESIERMVDDFEELELETVDAGQNVEAVVDEVLEVAFSDADMLAHSVYVW